MKCDICGSKSNVTEDICIDTKQLRGNVCSDCHIIIKLLNFDLDYLYDIFNYLNNFEKKSNNKWGKRFEHMKNID
jgi:hypothetical protein